MKRFALIALIALTGCASKQAAVPPVAPAIAPIAVPTVAPFVVAPPVVAMAPNPLSADRPESQALSTPGASRPVVGTRPSVHNLSNVQAQVPSQDAVPAPQSLNMAAPVSDAASLRSALEQYADAIRNTDDSNKLTVIALDLDSIRKDISDNNVKELVSGHAISADPITKLNSLAGAARNKRDCSALAPGYCDSITEQLIYRALETPQQRQQFIDQNRGKMKKMMREDAAQMNKVH